MRSENVRCLVPGLAVLLTSFGDPAVTRTLQRFEYRQLGIAEATQGKFGAHVIRAVPGRHSEAAWHTHDLDFQMVYVTRGWVVFEYEGPENTMRETGERLGHAFGSGVISGIAKARDEALGPVAIPVESGSERPVLTRVRTCSPASPASMTSRSP